MDIALRILGGLVLVEGDVGVRLSAIGADPVVDSLAEKLSVAPQASPFIFPFFSALSHFNFLF